MAALTRAEYKTLVQHWTGGNVNASMGSTSALTEVQLIDQSFHFLFDAHQWTWRKRGPVVLGTTNGGTQIPLPADFGETDSLSVVDGINDAVRETTLGEVMDLRSNEITTTNLYYVAPTFPVASSATELAPNPHYEVWPTPSATDSSTFRLTYFARYVPMQADTDVPNIPQWMELCAKDCLRAICLAHEDEDEGAYSRFMQSPVFQQAIKRDNRYQWRFGTMTNTAMQQVSRRERLPFDSVSDPS